MNYAFILLGENFKCTDTEAYFAKLVEDHLNNKVYLKKYANLNREELSVALEKNAIECLVIETFDNELNNRKQRRSAIANILTILTYRPKRIIFMPKQVREYIEIIKEWNCECDVFTYNTAVDTQPRKLML